MLKFNLCNPQIVYRSEILFNGYINTIHFDNEHPLIEPFINLQQYARSKNLTLETLENLCHEFNIVSSYDKKTVLSNIENTVKENNISNSELIYRFANAFYKYPIEQIKINLAKINKSIPSVFNSYIDSI
jgi:hypothetical protein